MVLYKKICLFEQNSFINETQKICAIKTKWFYRMTRVGWRLWECYWIMNKNSSVCAACLILESIAFKYYNERIYNTGMIVSRRWLFLGILLFFSLSFFTGCIKKHVFDIQACVRICYYRKKCWNWYFWWKLDIGLKGHDRSVFFQCLITRQQQKKNFKLGCS